MKPSGRSGWELRRISRTGLSTSGWRGSLQSPVVASLTGPEVQKLRCFRTKVSEGRRGDIDWQRRFARLDQNGFQLVVGKSQRQHSHGVKKSFAFHLQFELAARRQLAVRNDDQRPIPAV